MSGTSQTVVSLKYAGPNAYLQIERPEALNAINRDVLEQLLQSVEELKKRSDIHIVILSGAGEKAFVAGADIKQMSSLDAEAAQQFSTFGSEVFSALENLPQIVIAKIQGFALGGGLELAMGADFLIASAQARFGLPETSLGLIPGFGGTQRLAKRIGAARALEWLATADKYNAQDAFQAGLVNKVVAHEELTEAVEKLANQILKNGPSAVKRAKLVLRKGLQCSLEAGSQLESGYFGICFGTAEAKEGITAFIEKRPAQFAKG